MEKAKLQVRLREDLSKRRLKEMRRQGNVPGNFYGKGKPTLSLEIGLASLVHALKTEAGTHTMFDVEIEGAPHGEDGTAVIKAIQKDPITRKVLHVDFERVSAADQIVTSVSVVVIGEAPGIKDGGILETLMDSLEVKTRADRLVTHVDVDVSELQIGHFVHASDVELPDGVELASRPEDIVVALRPPHVRTAEAGTEATAGASEQAGE
jgi:large subunit ribosomal protein L25